MGSHNDSGCGGGKEEEEEEDVKARVRLGTASTASSALFSLSLYFPCVVSEAKR